MPNLFTERTQLLTGWLLRLVELIRQTGGSTWGTLLRAVAGKTGLIDLDGCCLRLRAIGGEKLQVEIEPIEPPQRFHFRCGGETLRDIIHGRRTIDEAISSGDLYVRAPLGDLLGIHALVMELLAESAVNPQWRRLWSEFEALWPSAGKPPACRSLERQRPAHGGFIADIPPPILRIRVR